MSIATQAPASRNGSEPATAVAPREVVLKAQPAQLSALDSVVQYCSMNAIAAKGRLEQTLTLAAGVRTLRSLITGDMMGDIMQLQGTPLGFRTDKDSSQGYPVEIVKDCVIEALLKGVRPVGNEFNIIAGRLYVTREGFERLVKEFPGLTDLRTEFGVPASANGGALVPCFATWRLCGKPDSITCAVTADKSDFRIPIKVNNGMGADAILGKAKRKLLARVYSRLTGSDQDESDEENTVTGKVVSREPRTLDDLTKRLESDKPLSAEPGAAETERETEPETDFMIDLLDRLEAAKSTADISAIVEHSKQFEFSPEQDIAFTEWCEKARDRIKSASQAKVKPGEKGSGKLME
jgi:hypothetical protein